MGYAAWARSAAELRGLLIEGLSGQLTEKLLPYQKKFFVTDGKNSERVAGVIKNLMRL